MGHAWVSQQAVISDVFTSVTNVRKSALVLRPGLLQAGPGGIIQ